MSHFDFDVCVVGGGGHVGAPLAAVFASRGLTTLAYDINEAAVAALRTGRFPYAESGGDAVLGAALASGCLATSSTLADVGRARAVVVTIGTPVDEFQNPVWDAVSRCIEELLPVLTRAELLVLRSTVSPGTTDGLQQFLADRGCTIPVAFCPERVVQGQAIEEIQGMPQMVSGTSPLAEARAAALFERIASSLVRMRPLEAEFAKLFCNAYRYIQFAASNQFFMMAQQAGCDYQRIVAGMKQDYPRMSSFPTAGFTAGPCLLKDTLQLAAASNYQFGLGHAAMHVNEGLPAFVVDDIRRRFPVHEMTVGILGMAFKAESDDIRSSLSYKLKKLLRLHARQVLTTDPFVTVDPVLLPVETVVAQSDLLVLATPHRAYRTLDMGGKPLVDIWNAVQAGPGRA
ncbi:MAG: nucleotide sugar dehydrogenase [Vicinamibacterales bacterium]|nr:nucleotide sugar dehydrogenase [Vicinamibacterales bacterium]